MSINSSPISIERLKNTDPMKIWIFILLTGFFTFQALSKTDAGNFASGLWLTGLAHLIVCYKNYHFSKAELTAFALAIIFPSICLLSSYISPFPLTSIFSLKNLFPFIIFPFLYIAISKGKLNKEDLCIIFFIAAIAYLLVALKENAVRIGGQENPVTFGNGAFLFCVISCYLCITNKKLYLRALALGATAMFFYAAIKSGTRGSFLALAFLFVYLFFLCNFRQKILFIISSLILFIAISQTSIYQRYAVAFNAIKNYDIKTMTSTGKKLPRIEMWKDGYCHFKQSPVLGIGIKNFRQAMTSGYNQCPKAHDFSQAHSFYINTLVTTGIVGFLCIALFLVSLGRIAKDNGRYQFRFFMVTILTILGYGLTVDLFFAQFLSYRHLISIALVASIFRVPVNKPE